MKTSSKPPSSPSVSVCFQDQLLSTIHGAFQVAVDITVQEVTKLWLHQMGELSEQVHESQQENVSLKQRLQEAEEQLELLRGSMSHPGATTQHPDILQMAVCKDEVSPEQEWSPSLLQEEPEPPHIKEEAEEILQRPEEPGGSMLTSLAVKSEVDDEDIASHCLEVDSDNDVTEDSGDWMMTSGGVHNGESFFQHSDQSFGRTDDLTKHQRVRHTKEKPFRCPYCEKSFNHSGHLKRHQLIHTGEKPFHCEHCGKLFSRTDDLKRHQRVHRTKEKPFQCNLCDKSFSRTEHLKTHHCVVHAGERNVPV